MIANTFFNDVKLCEGLLKYNFSTNDIKEYGRELLEQLWYEFSENNVRVELV